MVTLARSLALAVFAVLVSAAPGHAACDPTTDPDKTDIANARAAVAEHCNCTPSVSHGAYVSCAVQQANATLTNKSCAGFVKTCASRSTCGKPGFVTCCRTNASHLTKCSTKSDQAHCTPPKGGSACVGAFPSCCDAPCTATGGCVTTTTATTTSTTLRVANCNNIGAPCGTCGSGICFGPPGDCSNGNRCAAFSCPAGGCGTNCVSDQDCAAHPGTICVATPRPIVGGCGSFCFQACSPSGAFLDESF
jgi:hypothetical protein